MENIQYEFSWGKLCFTEDWEKKKRNFKELSKFLIKILILTGKVFSQTNGQSKAWKQTMRTNNQKCYYF